MRIRDSRLLGVCVNYSQAKRRIGKALPFDISFGICGIKSVWETVQRRFKVCGKENGLEKRGRLFLFSSL